MFQIGQTVSVLIADSLEEIGARVVFADTGSLALELDENTFPGIGTEAMIICDADTHQHQQPVCVSGHWQHARRTTVEFVRIGTPITVEADLNAV